MINPGEIPQIAGDIEAVARHGGTLRTVGGDFADTGSDVHSTWQGLSTFYQAPEAAQLFAATGPVRTRSSAVGADITSVGGAFVAYADEVRPIKATLERLRTSAQSFVDSVRGDDDWNDDGDKVDQHNQLMSEVAAAVSAWMAAQRTCANAINALCGGTQYVEDNGDETAAANEYGYSADLLGRAAGSESGVPWGRSEERDKPWYEDAWDGTKSFFSGVFVDGLWGDIEGLGNLVGFGGWDGLAQSWGGLAKLGMALTPSWLILNQFTALPGLEKGELGDTLTQFGKGFVAWDTWKDDPARAFGNTLYNVASIFVGTKGAGAAMKGGTAAAIASRAPRIAQIATKVGTTFGDIGARLRSGLRFDVPDAPDLGPAVRGADAPPVRVDAPVDRVPGDRTSDVPDVPDVPGDRTPGGDLPGDPTTGAPGDPARPDRTPVGDIGDQSRRTELEKREPIAVVDESRLSRVDGLVTEIDNIPVRDYVENLARDRAARHFELQQAAEPGFSRGKVGEVTSIAFDRRTGQVFEGHNGMTQAVPGNLHPTLQSRLDDMLLDGRHQPDGWPREVDEAGNVISSGPHPHPSAPGTHAEVYAVNRALLERQRLGLPTDASHLNEIMIDNRFPFIDRNNPFRQAPCCANCTRILQGIDAESPGMLRDFLPRTRTVR